MRAPAARAQRLRSASDEDLSGLPGPLFVATLRVSVNRAQWAVEFSRRHPTLRIDVLNRTDLSPRTSVSDLWIQGPAPGVWTAELSSSPEVLRAESLAEVAHGCIYRVAYRNPPVVGLFRRLGVPVQFPWRLQAGVLTMEIVAPRTAFDAILRFARAGGRRIQAVSVRHRPLRSHLPFLSEAQEQLLLEALAAGYFAVPRGITLTELARQIGRSKSSVSEALALIERKLLETSREPVGALP